MITSEIEQLLEKYFEGNTTLKEEKTLREFFLGNEVPEHLMVHRPLFTYQKEFRNKELPDSEFETKFTSMVGEETIEPAIVQMNTGSSRILYISGIAASILLLTGLLFTFQHDVFNRIGHKGNPTVEIAYTDASEALLLVSGNLNHGLKHVEQLHMVDKAMKNMELFNKFYQYQPVIINPDENTSKSIK